MPSLVVDIHGEPMKMFYIPRHGEWWVLTPPVGGEHFPTAEEALADARRYMDAAP